MVPPRPASSQETDSTHVAREPQGPLSSNVSRDKRRDKVYPRSHTKRHERRTNILRALYFIRVLFFVSFRATSWIKFFLPPVSNRRSLSARSAVGTRRR